MLARLVVSVLIFLPVATVIWLVLDRGFGVAHNLVTILNTVFISLLYVWLRLGLPTR